MRLQSCHSLRSLYVESRMRVIVEKMTKTKEGNPHIWTRPTAKNNICLWRACSFHRRKLVGVPLTHISELTLAFSTCHVETFVIQPAVFTSLLHVIDSEKWRLELLYHTDAVYHVGLWQPQFHQLCSVCSVKDNKIMMWELNRRDQTFLNEFLWHTSVLTFLNK